MIAPRRPGAGAIAPPFPAASSLMAVPAGAYALAANNEHVPRAGERRSGFSCFPIATLTFRLPPDAWAICRRYRCRLSRASRQHFHWYWHNSTLPSAARARVSTMPAMMISTSGHDSLFLGAIRHYRRPAREAAICLVRRARSRQMRDDAAPSHVRSSPDS